MQSLSEKVKIVKNSSTPRFVNTFVKSVKKVNKIKFIFQHNKIKLKFYYIICKDLYKHEKYN